MSYTKWTGKLVVALLCFAAAPAWAAQAPITLEANYLQYNDETGDVSASGNVKLNQEITQIFTQQLTGNVQTGDILANGQVTWIEEKNTLTGEQLNYNYKTKYGKMGPGKANMDGKLLTGQTTEMFPDKTIIGQGSITKCPAQTPDYKMTADKIEVYPGDKLIAYNVAFWIKNHKLFSMAKYTKSLKEEDKENSLLPKVGYESHEGIYIREYLEYPLQDKLFAMGEISYYTQRGLEYQYGLLHRGDHATTSLLVGAQANDDDEWFERRPELRYSHSAFQIGRLPYYLSYNLYSGRIIEDETHNDLWRSGGRININHTPIKLTDNTNLYLGGGYEYNWYENRQNRSIWRGHIKIKTKLNDRMDMGLGYYHSNPNGQTPFDFDDIDINDEFTSDFSWKIDRLWKFRVSTSYDLNNSEMHDVDYTITRNLHCFETAITYREKRDEWRIKIGLIDW